MKFKSLLFLLCGTFTLFAVDPGGVSIDFAKKTVQSTGKSLQYIPGGEFKTKAEFDSWKKHHWVHIGAKAGNYIQLLKDVKPYIKYDWKNQEGCIIIDNALHNMKDNFGRGLTVSNRLIKRFPAAPGNHNLTWNAHGTHIKGPAYSGFLVQLAFYDAKGKKVGNTFSQYPTLTNNKKDFRISGIAPEKTAQAEVTFCFYGPGNVSIDNVALTPQKITTGLSVKLNPHGFLDNLFCVPEKTPFTIHFGLKNVSGKKDGAAMFHIELPEEFSILAAREGNVMFPQGENRCSVDLTNLRARAPLNGYSSTFPTVNLMIVAKNLKASNDVFQGKYWVEENGVKGTVETFSLKVLPVTHAKQPARFKTGFAPMNDFSYSAANSKHLKQLFQTTGFNGGTYIPGGLIPVMNQLGIEVYAEAVANGYRIGPNPKPDFALFRGADGKPLLTPGNTQNICPTEVYRQGEYYKGKVIPYFNSLMDKGITHLMANWEPFMFDRRGCFCARCKTEFIRYSKLPEKEVTANWGSAILEKYRDLWTKFRSWQHGELVKTLNQTMNELGKKRFGKESFFIPMVSYTLFTTPRQHAEYALEDYIDHLQWLEPWGPYIYYRYEEPYQENCGWNIVTWLAAKKMKESVIKRQPDKKKRTKLIAFPHSYQGTDWVTEPETLAFETLLFFVNGFEGSFAYLFPLGYDYRYWKALAETNNTIANLESYFLDGKDISSKIETVLQTPLPKPNPPDATAVWSTAEGMGEVEKVSLLQHTAVTLNGKTLAAIGNFWKHGEAFYTFKLKGLKSGKYTVSDPAAKLVFGTFTNKELEKGILMQTGALRWRFLLVEPQTKAEGKQVTQKALRNLMQKRLPKIRKAFEKEQKLQSEKFVVSNDYSKLKPLSAQGMTIKAVKVGGKDFLQLNTSEYSLEIHPEQGGAIRNWKTKSGEALSSPGDTLGLGNDSFMEPTIRNWNTPWQIAGIRSDLEGITLAMKFRIPQAIDLTFGGLEFVKTYQFLPDGIRFRLEVRNSNSKNIAFVYRSHNQNAYLSIKNKVSGIMKTGTVEVKRKGNNQIIRVSGAKQRAERHYAVKVPVSGGTATAEFSAPWHNYILKLETSGNVGFYGIWDDLPDRMKYATEEILFEQTNLAPGAKKVFELKWSFKKK